MRLTPDHHLEYLKLTRQDDSQAALNARLEKLRHALEQGRDPELTRLFIGPEGAPQACLRLVLQAEGHWSMTPIHHGASAPPAAHILAPLLTEALTVMRSRHARTLTCRVPQSRLNEAYRSAMLDTGFHEVGGRIEYKTPVEALPDEGPSPLSWRGMSELGLDFAAGVFSRAALGAADWDPEHDDPRELIPAYLSEEGLTQDTDCVQVGFINDKPVAFVVAQVEPATGWSRITYMGVVPEARGQGLGQWVHRRGFALIRQQDGTLYHGGTAITNTAMRRLFERHGCQVYEQFVEWLQRFAA